MQKQLDQWVTNFQRFGKTNMDFAALQQKLFDIDPSDRAEDLKQLAESAGKGVEDMPTVDYITETAQVAEGSLGMEGDYSLTDFAALAGVSLKEDAGSSFDNAYKNYNNFNAFGSDKGKKAPVKKKDVPTNKVFKKDPHTWQSFLKQHTAQLKQISTDPKKKAQFDRMMAKIGEGVEEDLAPTKDQLKGKELDALRNKNVAKMRKDDEAAKKTQRAKFDAAADDFKKGK